MHGPSMLTFKDLSPRACGPKQNKYHRVCLGQREKVVQCGGQEREEPDPEPTSQALLGNVLGLTGSHFFLCELQTVPPPSMDGREDLALQCVQSQNSAFPSWELNQKPNERINCSNMIT